MILLFAHLTFSLFIYVRPVSSSKEFHPSNEFLGADNDTQILLHTLQTVFLSPFKNILISHCYTDYQLKPYLNKNRSGKFQRNPNISF